MTIRELMAFWEQRAPLALSEEWDNPGLLVGDPDAEVTGVTCLDGCICRFIIPDFTDTDDVRVTANGRAKSCRKTFHITPDFGLMGWQKVFLREKHRRCGG